MMPTCLGVLLVSETGDNPGLWAITIQNIPGQNACFIIQLRYEAYETELYRHILTDGEEFWDTTPQHLKQSWRRPNPNRMYRMNEFGIHICNCWSTDSNVPPDDLAVLKPLLCESIKEHCEGGFVRIIG